MLREIDLKEISDGKLYGSNDMARADCKGCEGCSACCRGMGDSIVLDPLDAFRLTQGLNRSMEELLTGPLKLSVVDGIILPNLAMAGPGEACSFLDADGRCSIHAYRPGFCRLFPLGRYYKDHSFLYFLQVHECPYPKKEKIKIRKWIDTDRLKEYEDYITDWHYYLKDLQDYALSGNASDASIRAVSMYILKQFYLTPYQPLSEQNPSFYPEFYARLKEAMDTTDALL